MVFEQSLQLSIIGVAFLLAYISFNLERKHTTLKVLFIFGSLMLGYASLWANFSIVSQAGLNASHLQNINSVINAVAFPYMWFMILFIFYIFAFIIWIAVREYPKFFNPKKFMKRKKL